MTSTRHDHRKAAEKHDWTVGTRLVGDAGYGPTIIQISALCDKVMLARIISHGCRTVGYHDAQAWTLSLRDWQSVG